MAVGHDDIVELLGAFALDAVDEDERVLVEDHLRECPRCVDEVRNHREVAAALAFGGAAAPEGVWGRIAAELAPPGIEPDLTRLYPFRRHSQAGWFSGGRRRGTAWVLAAAAVIVVMMVGGLGWEVRAQNGRVSGIRSALSVNGLDRAAQAASLDPQTTKFVLTSLDGGIKVNAVLATDGTGFLIPAAHKALPELPPGETYQLWGVAGAQRVSVGVLGPKPDLVAFRASDDTMVAMAITVEHAGGVIQSSHAPVAAGFVRPRTA